MIMDNKKDIEQKEKCECNKDQHEDKKKCKCDKEKEKLNKQIEELNNTIESLKKEVEEAKHKSVIILEEFLQSESVVVDSERKSYMNEFIIPFIKRYEP